MLRVLTIVCVFLSAHCALDNVAGRERLYYTREIIESEGYPAETHHVVSNDGYILELHRIPFGRNSQSADKTRPVVFLMHGILAGSNSFIFLGPENAIAYNLADVGYDVWMGNARGTKNSRRHVALNPDTDKNFFEFSFEDIALDDLPTMIDYVLTQTGQPKLHYIGHSQGGTVFLVLNSMKTEYNSKIASAHLLAGVGYQHYFPNSQLRALAVTTDVVYNLFRLQGLTELFPPGTNDMFGRSNSAYRGLDIFDIDPSKYELIAGAALKQVAHFGQNIRDKAFRRWDYGAFQNLGRYGSFFPPIYDLSKINIDVTMHYSLNDFLLDERDVHLMVGDMPNARARKVARDSFTHLDYVTSTDVKEQVTDYIIEALKNYKEAF